MDTKRQIASVGALVVWACLVQAWMIHRAVVPAQDALRYLIVAQGMARNGWTATLAAQYEQPLFPTLVWLTHAGFTQTHFIADSDWAICLQMAAAIPLVLTVVPVYLLLLRLQGPRAAVVGAWLFVLVSELARLGADGLSDSTHLCLCCWALWAITAYFAAARVAVDRGDSSPSTRRRGAGWLAAAGVLSGFAMLARAEALALPAAFLTTIALMQARRAWRLAWPEAITAVLSFGFGLSLILGSYLALCGAWQAETAWERLLSRRGVVENEPLNVTNRTEPPAPVVEQRWHLEGAGRLVFGRKDPAMSSRFHGAWAAAVHLGEELLQALQYWLGGLALLGYWRLRHRTHGPVDRFVQILCALVLGAAWYLGVRAGYLSTRHVLLVLVFALGWAGVGALALGEALAELGRRRGWRLAPRTATAAVMVATTALCLVSLVRPLHASRVNHREAAAWLADHADLDDVVLDSRGWTALYTGLPTYRYEAAQAAFSHPRLAFVVVEQAEMEMASQRGETMRRLVAAAGEPVARFSVPGAKPDRDVVVHRWHPQRFGQLGERLHAR
jgi:hypothetical protein